MISKKRNQKRAAKGEASLPASGAPTPDVEKGSDDDANSPDAPDDTQGAAGHSAGGDPRVRPAGARLWIANLALFALWALLTIDALPNSFPGIGRLDTTTDAVVDVLGLAQGDWKLFSPDPDHVNAYVEAQVTFADGSTRRWTTPDWRDRSLLQKFFEGRHPKFSDAFRMDRNKAAWPFLCDYVVRQVKGPKGIGATRVELIRYWWEVPKPEGIEAEMAKYKHMPPHPDEYPHRFSFYTKEYP